ncbi:deoxyribose-phosphate aldolase [Hymenobacter busanensis]|uniref:Deoxyribose-phosphate aldolase n=1 Tax=Hymenobacter busanensis TaxID=2607656 RepID=A0A7L4ZZK3_9BACT|nr:deoxyribose-phosphate aldolase [Hymenobacter busanensis]KAA9338617.1 deoxyribose-phosphate aldolase [Hymenobacter busanensis]QHJ08954.1 deoxyribose-phosphate aldolase [Hymenobacter busanensis]
MHDPHNLAGRIDHTLLRPDATRAQIEQLCTEARAAGFASVCVPPHYVPVAAAALQGSGVAVCTVIGFPLGYSTPAAKQAEAAEALRHGATELDMVLNNAAFASGDDALVQHDIEHLAQLCHRHGALLKVIIETALLTPDDIRRACDLCAAAGADFVKTSTGFASRGASVDDVRLMRDQLPARIRIKAAGGIRSHAQAVALVQAGADRLGASAGLALLVPDDAQPDASAAAHEPTAY